MHFDLLLSALPASGLPQSGAGVVVLAIVSILINLGVCFFGYKLFKVFVAIIGFLGGVCLGLAAAGQTSWPFWVDLVLVLVLGVILAVLALKVYKVGVFLFCGLLPGVLCTLLAGGIWVGLAAFLVFGVLGVLLTRFYIIAVSAVSSGLLAGQQLFALFPVDVPAAAIILGLVLAVAGFLFQWKTTRPEDDPKNGQAAPPAQG